MHHQPFSPNNSQDIRWTYSDYISAVNHKHFEDLKIKVLTYYIMRSAPWRGAAVHGVGTKLSRQHLHPNVARHHTGTLWKAIIEKMCLSDMKLMPFPPSGLPGSCETERLRGQHQLWQRWALRGWAITGLQIDISAENTAFGCLRGGRSVRSYIYLTFLFCGKNFQDFGGGTLRSSDQPLTRGFRAASELARCGGAADMRILLLLYISQAGHMKPSLIKERCWRHAPAEAPNHTRRKKKKTKQRTDADSNRYQTFEGTSTGID